MGHRLTASNPWINDGLPMKYQSNRRFPRRRLPNRNIKVHLIHISIPVFVVIMSASLQITRFVVPVLSVNSNLSGNQPVQSAPKAAVPLRAEPHVANSATQANHASTGTVSDNEMPATMGAGAQYQGNCVGVAAHIAIMNPQALTSMRIEA